MDDTSTWSECPPGTLTQVARRAEGQRLLGLAARTSALALVLFGVTFGAWFGSVWWRQRGVLLNGLTCAEVHELLPAYRTGKLDERRSAMLRGHVARCTNCAKFRLEVLGETSAHMPTPPADAAAIAIFKRRYVRMAALAASRPGLSSGWRVVSAP